MKYKSTSVMAAFVASAAIFIAASATHAEDAVQSYADILAVAEKENRPIVLEFTGSDWCPPCKALYKEVISQDEFKNFAESQVVFVKLDFPNKKQLPEEEVKRNAELGEKFNVTGYPTLVVLSPKGVELDRMVGYGGGGPDAVISWIKTAAKM